MFLILTPLTLKALGNEKYGVWTVILAILQFSGLANFSTGISVVKFIAQYSNNNIDDNENLSTTVFFSYIFMLVMGIIASLILFLIRNFLIQNINLDFTSYNDLENGIGVVAFCLIPLFLQQVSRGILLGLVKNILSGALEVTQNLVLWLGIWVIGIFGGKILHLALWSLIVNIGFFLVTLYFSIEVLKPFNLKLKINKKIVYNILNYSFYSWVNSIGISLFQTIDRILVGMVLGPSIAGVYSIASSLALRLNMLAGQFTQVLTPLASSYYSQSRFNELSKIFRNVSEFTGQIMCFVACFLVVWMNDILRIWISQDFANSYTLIFQVMVIAYSLFSMHRTAHQILCGIGYVKFSAIITIFSSVLMLSLLYIFSINFGVVGSVYSNFFYCLVLSMNFYLSSKLGLKPVQTVIKDLGFSFLLLTVLMLYSIFELNSILIKISGTILVMFFLIWVVWKNYFNNIKYNQQELELR